MSKKILIVEDDECIRESLAHALKDEGYEVITAVNGDEGLERLWECLPDLVILDLMMPVMTGFEFKKIMDSHPDRVDIPVIVFTAQPYSVSPDMNVAAVINKSTPLDKILETITLHL
jgi:CheY-like chemotaxis protein